MPEGNKYVVLSRKYRPQTFDDVIGQSHVTQTLKNAVKNVKVAQAYLFSGPRGVGKTSSARILAKCLNCESGPTITPCGKCDICKEITEGNSLDILEIDAASHTQVDKIRDIIVEKVKFVSGHSRYKMYIIDEVHMLSSASFNALLKTIEDPPPRVIFVLATTAPHKVPQTIISRCQWFALKRISSQDLVSNLSNICRAEKIKISDKSLYAIARHAEGSLRDAQVALDQIVSFAGNEVKDEDTDIMLGTLNADLFESFFSGIAKRDTGSLVTIIGDVINNGYEIESFIRGLQEYVRNLILLNSSKEEVTESDLQLIDLPKEEIKKMKYAAGVFSEEEKIWILGVISQTQKDLRQFEMRGQEKLILEIMAIRLAKRDFELSRTGADDNDLPGKNMKDGASVDRGISGSENKKKTTTIKNKLFLKVQENCPVSSAEGPDVSEAVPDKNVPKEDSKPSVPISRGNLDTEIGIEEITEKWNEVIAEMKKRKRGLAYLFEELRPIEVKGDIISAGFNKELLIQKERTDEKENRDLIRSILKEIYGRPLKIEFLQEDRVQIEQKKEEARVEPVVKRVADLFNAEIVGRNKLKS